MWMTMQENDFVLVYTYKGVCYQGRVVKNTDEYVQLKKVEVYDHDTLYMQQQIQLAKEDIEVMAKIVFLSEKERLQ